MNVNFIPQTPEAERALRLHGLDTTLTWPRAKDFLIGDVLAPKAENAYAALRITGRVWNFSTTEEGRDLPPLQELLVSHLEGVESRPSLIQKHLSTSE